MTEAVVKGDTKVFTIAAASIIAKGEYEWVLDRQIGVSAFASSLQNLTSLVVCVLLLLLLLFLGQ